MLQTQLVDIVFSVGADTKTDDKNTVLTKFSAISNSRVDRVGALMPRGGVTQKALTSSLIPTAGPGPGFGSVASRAISAHLKDGTAWRVTSEGAKVLGSEVRGDAVRRYLGNALSRRMSSAVGGDRICTAWGDTVDGLFIMTVTVQTLDGESISQTIKYVAAAITNIAVVYCTSQFYVIYETSTGGGTLFAERANATETGGLSSVTWTPPAAGSKIWDVDADSQYIYLCYVNGASVNPSIQRITPTGALFSTTTTTPTSGLVADAKAIACRVLTGYSTGAVLALTVVSNTPAQRLLFFTSALVQVGATVTVSTSVSTPTQCWIAQRDSTSLSVGASGRPSGSYTEVAHSRALYVNGTGITTNRIEIHNYNHITKPVYLDDKLYCVVDSITVPTYGSQALLEMVSTSSISDPGFVFGASRNLGNQEICPVRALPNVQVSGTRYYFPVCFVGSVTSLSANAPASNTITRVQSGLQNQASLLILDQSKYTTKLIDTSSQQSLLVGSVGRHASSYRQIAAPWPELGIETGTSLRLDVNTAPTVPFTGTVSCVFAKVLTLADGSVYRLYSPIFTALLSAAAIRYTISNTDLLLAGGGESSVCSIEFYKTEPDGTVFYFANTYASAGTRTDDVSNTALLAGRLAEINANELYPEVMAGVRTAVKWKSRLAAVVADKPTVVKFDKPSTYPQGTTFADGLEVEVGSEGGDITALGSMDSALYIFKSNSILTLYGDPAGATGENGSLSIPTLLKQGLGTPDPRSIILTPKGLMFNSQKGFYLILRNQEFAFIGDGPYASRTVTITGADVDVTQSEVYFSYTDGSIWVYNYDTNQWYKWQVVDAARGVAVYESALSGSSDAGYWEYSKTTTVDQPVTGSPVEFTQSWTTGWIRTSNIRGYQRARRVYFVGACTKACTLTLEVYVDYGTTAVQTFTLPLTVTDPLQIDLHLKVQKCESIRFKFTTDKAGLTLSGGTLELGIKQGRDHSRSSGSNVGG